MKVGPGAVSSTQTERLGIKKGEKGEEERQ